MKAGASPANKFGGEAISVIFGSQVSLRVHYCKRDEVYCKRDEVYCKRDGVYFTTLL